MQRIDIRVRLCSIRVWSAWIGGGSSSQCDSNLAIPKFGWSTGRVDTTETVVVPAGRFTMGSPANEPQRRASWEEQVRVSVPAPFSVGRSAVTFDEWDGCVADVLCASHPGIELVEGDMQRPETLGLALDGRLQRVARRSGMGSRQAPCHQRQLARCQSICRVALQDMQDLSPAIGSGTEIRDARRYDDAILVGSPITPQQAIGIANPTRVAAPRVSTASAWCRSTASSRTPGASIRCTAMRHRASCCPGCVAELFHSAVWDPGPGEFSLQRLDICYGWFWVWVRT
jgi:hypothetical protein